MHGKITALHILKGHIFPVKFYLSNEIQSLNQSMKNEVGRYQFKEVKGNQLSTKSSYDEEHHLDFQNF